MLLHDAFEAHQDHFAGSGADIGNISLSRPPPMSCGTLADADEVVRAARRDAAVAAALLLEHLQWPPPAPADGGRSAA